MLSEEPYRLSCQVIGHAADIKGVVSWGNRFVTCSRDTTIRVWKPQATAQGVDYLLEQTFAGHADFVNAVDAYGSMESGFLVSGSKDKTARIWGNNGETKHVLARHSQAVSSVKISADGSRVVTSSWDSSAMVWDTHTGDLVCCLQGHESSVWDAIPLSDGTFVSVCADKHMRLFTSTGQPIAKIQAHKDACRSITLIPDSGSLVTSANNGEIKVWSPQADLLQTIDEHDGNPVYHVTFAGGMLLTSSEERNFKLFAATNAGFKLQQSIPHPCFLWASCALSNGDLVTAGSDGVARVWTRDNERRANESALQAFDTSLATQEISSSMVGQINKSSLGGLEALNEPGSQPDQRKLINNNGKVEIYQWVGSEMRWAKVGDVVDTEKPQPKVLDGKSYDYVFDVDVQEGAPPLKIGFNKGDDAWEVAQQFLTKNDLPSEYRSQVFEFLLKNVGPDAGMAATQGVSDPLTGGNRYVPGSSSMPAARFNSQSVQPQTISKQHFESAVNMLFETGNFAGMQKKLDEFNGCVLQEVALSESDSSHVQSLVKILAGEDSAAPSPEHWTVVQRLLAWPEEHILPVLDVIRLYVTQKTGAEAIASDGDATMLQVAKYAELSHKDPVRMLAMRFLCNCFKHGSMRELVTKNMGVVLKVIEGSHQPNWSKNARWAYSSLLNNYAVSVKALAAVPFDLKMDLVSQLSNSIQLETEPGIQHILCQAFGILVVGDPLLKEASRAEGSIMSRITALGSSPDANVSKCAKDLAAVISA